MTSHELARKLLDLPDLPLTVEDIDGDRAEIQREPLLQNASSYGYFDRSIFVTEGQYIYIF